MNAIEHGWLMLLGYPVTALVFLLVGWRLGRKRAGRPSVASRNLPVSPDEAALEVDPWTEAVLGGASVTDDLDSFETVRSFCGKEKCRFVKG